MPETLTKQELPPPRLEEGSGLCLENVLGLRVQHLSNICLPENSPAKALYKESRSTARHFEGEKALEVLLDLLEEQRERPEVQSKGIPVVSRAKMLERIWGFLNYGEILFNKIKEVEAIVIFGSILWKEEPGDFDSITFCSYEAPNTEGGYQYSVMNRTENTVYQGIKKSEDLPDEIQGIRRNPGELFIYSYYYQGDTSQPGIGVLHNGPFLVMLRGEEIAEGISGPLRIFLNCDKSPMIK